jgi:hypothetical protein
MLIESLDDGASIGRNNRHSDAGASPQSCQRRSREEVLYHSLVVPWLIPGVLWLFPPCSLVVRGLPPDYSGSCPDAQRAQLPGAWFSRRPKCCPTGMKTRQRCCRLPKGLTPGWAIAFKFAWRVGRAPDRVNRLRDGMTAAPRGASQSPVALTKSSDNV